MKQINQLKQDITDIESTIDPKATKEELYDILVVAYYKAKDIIEIYGQQVPLDEVELDVTKDEVATLSKRVRTLNEELSEAQKSNGQLEDILDQIAELAK